MIRYFWRYEVVIVGMLDGITPLFTTSRHFRLLSAMYAYDNQRKILDTAADHAAASVLDVEIRNRKGLRLA